MELNLLVIRTSAPRELVSFYEKLGLEFEHHRHGKGPLHYSALINKLVFEIYPLQKSQEGPDISLRLGFEVEKLDALIQKLRKSGSLPIHEPTNTEWGYTALIPYLQSLYTPVNRGLQF